MYHQISQKVTPLCSLHSAGRSVPLPDPKTLQQLKVSVVSQADCEKKRRGLTKNMLCAADPNKGGDACDVSIQCNTFASKVNASMCSSSN